MNIIKQPKLDQITIKHLIDHQSDELYQPIRDINYECSLKKYEINSQRYGKIYQFSQNSYVPSELKGLQISNERIAPQKCFRNIAERQKQYQSIPQGVMKILQEEYQGPQKIVYRYSTKNQNDEGKYGYKTVGGIKTAENRANFKQNLEKRLNRIDQIEQKKPGYNLYSFLDEPLSFIRSKI